MYGNKGMSFTLEAVIAGLLVVTALLFFFRAPADDTYSIGVSERGYYCLKSLDENAVLRPMALGDDSSGIEAGLSECLAGMNYTVQVCRASCTPASLPENRTVIVSSYFIAGDVNPDPLKVKLSMWLQ